MNFFQKILSAAVVATLATSVVATSASAHNPKNYKSPGGIFPTLIGPIGAAALFPATKTFAWTTLHPFKHFYKWQLQIIHHKPYINIVKIGPLDTKPGCHLLHGCLKVEKVKGTDTKHHSRSSKTVGKAVVGCIFGSALGAITASIRKASAMGNPPRWRSQAEHERIVASGVEKKFELTNDEAHTAVALCGAGSLTLHWQNAI